MQRELLKDLFLPCDLADVVASLVCTFERGLKQCVLFFRRLQFHFGCKLHRKEIIPQIRQAVKPERRRGFLCRLKATLTSIRRKNFMKESQASGDH